VLIGGLSEHAAERYVEELERHGMAWRFFDAFAFHPYASTPQKVLGRLNAIRAVLARDPHLASKPVWITEVGFHAEQKNFPYPGKTPNEQVKASYLTQTYTALRDAGISAPIFCTT
jgi:exo-beta-1,3-glucanase (GH17 family)